jgi:hypothetical protein
MSEKQVRSQNLSKRSATENTEYQSRDGSGRARLRRDSPWTKELQDRGMTMAELVEFVHKLVQHENLPFFLGIDGRFHPWKTYRASLKPSRRPATVERGRAASREASSLRGISAGASRTHQ